MMRAISRLERPCSKCSRRTSWILRMDNLLLVKQPSGKYREVATVIPLPPAHSGRVKLSSLARNQCPVCAGTGVQFAVESVSSLAWNGCPVWRGKRTHITAIEAGLGAEIDHDVRRRPKVNGTNPGATVRIATRLSILLKDDACYDGFRRIFEARSEFVHGRTMRKIKAEDRLLARRLARRMAAELVARSR